LNKYTYSSKFLNTYSNDSFVQLPAFTRWLLNNHFKEFLYDQLQLSFKVKIPLLERLQHFTEEQLLEIGQAGGIELLTYLANQQQQEYMQLSLDRYLADQLEIIGKYDLVAEDITLLNFVRSKIFRKYIPLYTSDVSITLQIIDELDIFLTGINTAALNIYIYLLKEQIAWHETNLLEAQEIAVMGSFEQDLVKKTSTGSPMLGQIFGLDGPVKQEDFMKQIH